MKPEPTVLKRLNQAIRSWPSDAARVWTRRMVVTASTHPSVVALVAIGSAVRGAGAARDVDFVLFHTSSRPPHVGPLPLDVDLRAYDVCTVEEKLAAKDDILGWAVQFGVLLCERDQYWSRLTQRWANRVPLPSASQAAERAVRARRMAEALRSVGDLEAAAEQHISRLTQDARILLINVGEYPASRPELAAQLRDVGARFEADALEAALAGRRSTLRGGFAWDASRATPDR